MAILYKANETDFNHLGLGPLNDAVSILVTEERNGIFELEMKYPTGGSRFSELKNDRLIKADAGHELKNQRFKIIRISKPIDGIVTVYAEHVSYLSADLPLKPNVSYNGNAEQALRTWQNNIVDVNPFIVSSDITTTGGGTWSIKDVKSAREALGGVAGSILDTYGGEYRFDNYHVRLMAQRGVNSGALIAYGRNLTDLTQEETIADTYTSIYPYSVYNDDNNKEVLITLPEYFIDSEYVGNYARRKILPVDFSNEEITTVEQLRSRTKTYIKSNNVGIPKVNMKIKYVDLAKTLDYKDVAILEQINLCDNVTVYFEKFGINTKAKIIKTVWDDLLEQYDSVEVGEARSSLSKQIGSVVDGKLETVVQRVNTIQLTADGLNVINRGVEEPPPGKVGDLWYEPDGIYTNMYQWDGVIWKLMLSTRDLGELKEEVESIISQAETDRQKTEQDIAQAVKDAQQYTEAKAQEFDAQMVTVNQEIDTISQAADAAVAKADEAIEEAGFAKTDASAAVANATTALNTAQIAANDASTALTNAGAALDRVGAVETTASNLTTYYNELTQTVGVKADRAIVDGINRTVTNHTSQIEANAEGLLAKADKNLVDTLKGTVDSHSTQIQLNAEGLEFKADKSFVDTIKGTLDNHTTQISANSQAINARLTETQINTLLNGKNYVNETTLNATANGLSASITQVSNDLSGLEIGGRNLLLKSNVPYSRNNYDVADYYLSESISEGEVVTLVFKGELGSGKYYFGIYNSGGSVSMTQISDLHKNEDGIYFKSFEWKIGTATNTFIRIYHMPSAISVVSTIEWTKLVRGNKTSLDWTPASEDMATLEQFTTIDATVKGLQTTVGNKAEQSQVTQLANQVSSKVESSTYNSKMTQLDNTINLKVSANEVLAQINLSTEGILIQGKRIQLDGDVTMTTAYVNDLKAKSLEAVYADIATVRTKLLTANVVESTHIKSDTALVDKIFATDANVNRLTSKTAFVNSVKAIDISADRITTGTLNAANVNIINLNANAITSGTIDGANSDWNLNTGIMNFRDPSTGDNLKFAQGRIEFQNGAQGRQLLYNAEGLQLRPFSTNTGTSRNTSLHLIGGATGSYQYIQFIEGGSNSITQRLEAEGGNIRALVGPNGEFQVKKYNTLALADVNANAYKTYDAGGDQLTIIKNEIKTPRYGAKNIYLTPQGTGIVKIADTATGNFYNIQASTFLNSSSRKLKTNIVAYNGSALGEINQLQVVTYNLKKDIADGVNNPQIGFIAEDSPSIASVDNQSIDMYKLGALNARAIQELSATSSIHEARLATVDKLGADIIRIDTFVSQQELDLQQLKKENESLKERITELEERIA